MLKKIGVKNIHPRLYKTTLTNKLFFSIEKTSDGHIWVRVGKVIFTSQPRGDGLWDDFWNCWDSTRISKKFTKNR